jgi:arginase
MSQTDEFLYFDANVLDDAILAIDFQLPGGPTWVEIKGVLRAAIAHPKAVGMEITILNPRLGADGNGLSALMDMLTSVFPKQMKNLFSTN